MIIIALVLISILLGIVIIKYLARRYYKNKLDDMNRGFEDESS